MPLYAPDWALILALRIGFSCHHSSQHCRYCGCLRLSRYTSVPNERSNDTSQDAERFLRSCPIISRLPGTMSTSKAQKPVLLVCRDREYFAIMMPTCWWPAGLREEISPSFTDN